MSSSKETVCCLPITGLGALLKWEKSDISWSEFAVEKSRRAHYVLDGSLEKSVRYCKSSTPRTLLCHDMKGGYLEDRFAQGTSCVTDPYIFTHWSLVDIFVYFSHQFVTIPPLGWINAGHLHGVQVLGTIITEWKDGEKLWQELYEDEEKLDKMIDKLVEICKHCKFDGYLVNIENKVPEEHLDKMKQFVANLTRKMHEHVEDSLVIWYDSVISPSGELKWQNELNDSNKDFFHNSDGIFLNYNWTEDTLRNSVMNAGVRNLDVFVGVDVFGRGCFGGGGFNSNLAMEKIRQFELSAAIFGHGWTHETKEDAEFHGREHLFWSKLRPYLFTNVMMIEKKLYTSFNNGYGKFSFHNGRKEKDMAQYDLSKQSLQTCSTHDFEYEDGFNGTGCVKIKKSKVNNYHVLFFNISNVQKQFKLMLATKCNTNYDYKISVSYEEKCGRQKKHRFILKKDEKASDQVEDFSSSNIYENELSSYNHRNQKELVWFQSTWDVRNFTVVPKSPGVVSQIGIEFISDTDECEFLLGELKFQADGL